jgi:hypothetical protein
LQHRGNLMAAEVEANGFVIGHPYSRRPRFSLRLGKVWHEEIIVYFVPWLKDYRSLCPKPGSDSELIRCGFAPNRLEDAR